MQVTVGGRHTPVQSELRERSIRQVERFASFLGGMDQAQVLYWEEVNGRTLHRWTCEITVDGHGHHVRAKATAPTGSAALDAAVEKIERQMRMLKTKRNRQRHQGSPDRAAGVLRDHLTTHR